MFQLHQRTRRRAAVALFLLLAVLPTLAVLAYGLARRLPGAAARESRRLSAHLRLPVALGGVRHPRPGVVEYLGLTIADPETGRTLFECDRVELRRQQSKAQGEAREELLVSGGRATLDAAHVDWIREMVEQALGRRAGAPRVDVRLDLSELDVHGAAAAWTLQHVECRLQNGTTQTALELEFLSRGPENNGSARIRLARNLQIRPPANALELETGGNPLPCGLLAVAIDAFEGLGADCRFRGRLLAHGTPDGWTARLSGELVDVDLQTLVTDRFGHRMSGAAEVAIEAAEIRGGRLIEAAGTFSARSGVIGRPLLEAATRWLALEPASGLVPGEDPVSFETLAVRFLLRQGSLNLRGQCPGASEAAAATGRYGPLLTAPADHAVPAVALAGLLALPEDRPFPATARTARLAERLSPPPLNR